MGGRLTFRSDKSISCRVYYGGIAHSPSKMTAIQSSFLAPNGQSITSRIAGRLSQDRYSSLRALARVQDMFNLVTHWSEGWCYAHTNLSPANTRPHQEWLCTVYGLLWPLISWTFLLTVDGCSVDLLLYCEAAWTKFIYHSAVSFIILMIN